jgi:hypothetical protein
MVTPSDYIEFVLFEAFKEGEFDKKIVKDNGTGWLKKTSARQVFAQYAKDRLGRFGHTVPKEATEFGLIAFDSMLQESVFEEKAVPYGPVYVRTSVDDKDNYLNERLRNNGVAKLVEEFGPSIIADVIANLATMENWGLDAEPESAAFELQKTAPASDRIVTLSHNQISEIEDQAISLFKELDDGWSAPNEPDETSLAVGQVRGGLELVRAGILRIDLFKMSMIAGLKLLIERYKDHAIGAAAGNLLSVILKHFGVL